MSEFIRRIDVQPMHCDDITRDILIQYDGITIDDARGMPLYIEANRDPHNPNWLIVTDHKKRKGRVYVGIGR